VQKRYQVLIPEWLEDYIKLGVKKFGLSFSELLRLEICLSVISTMEALYPAYKTTFTTKEVFQAAQRYAGGKVDREERDKLISKVYFEARKAIEFRLSLESRD
jgi:hypothetical protein